MNSNEADFEKARMVCLLCQNPYTRTEFYDEILSAKVVHNCSKYLHTAITENDFRDRFNEAECQLCPQCFASAVHLAELDDQLAILQKSINDFVLIFSLKILHQQTTKVNEQQPKVIVELDISKFPGVFNETDLLINTVVDPLLVGSPYPKDGLESLNTFKEVKIKDEEPENTFENEGSFIYDEYFRNEEDEYAAANENKMSNEKKTNQNQLYKELQINVERFPGLLNSNGTLIPFQNEACVSKKSFLDDSEVKFATVLRGARSDSRNIADSLENPVKRVELKSYLCSVCGKRFKSVLQCKIHLRRQDPEHSYKCHHCALIFANRCLLIKHLRTHTDEKPRACSVCPKALQTPSDLVRHMRTHTREKPHKCSVCQKAFQTPSDLARHMLTHTGEKAYKCSVCSKAFRTNWDCTRHMRIHTGEKRYQCTVCQMCFTHAKSLKVHILRHKGEKPYKCTSCSKAFTTKWDLTRHMRIHTDEVTHENLDGVL